MIDVQKSHTMITGNSIPFFRLMMIRQGLRAEGFGMRLTRGVSCQSIAKREFGCKGNLAKVTAQFEEIFSEAKKIHDAELVTVQVTG